MANASYERIVSLRDMLLFHRTAQDGTPRIVSAPTFFGGVPSAFERLGRFGDVPMEIGRLGNHHVDYACCGFDIAEDGPECLEALSDWILQGGINVRLMSEKQC